VPNFTVKVEDRAVREALNALARRVGDLQPVMQSIGEDVMERTKQRFETSTGPDGKRWQPNARATIEAFIDRRGGFGKRGINKKGAALAMNKRPLIDGGDLRRQFHVAATGNAVTIGNSMIYAAIHQFGGQAGRGKKVTIPARPFLPVTNNGSLYPDDRRRVLEAINGYLMGR
jgi:phage virion morphogenesis protein